MVARPKSPCEALLPQFYAGRNIFITGATGFMGKVLIERLLSTCPDVGKLHLLVRQKKGVGPEKRLLKLKESQVFDMVRQDNPSQLDKLFVILGDMAESGLGISAAYLKQLEDVTVVFHLAADVKLDEPLPIAVEQNVRSVIRLMEICDTLPNLQALIYVSTAYSNSERQVIEEKVYTAPISLPHLLAIVDAVPGQLLADITPQYIKPKPNTYTFTKAVAEEAVRNRGNKNYPIAIFRPTVVISSFKNPYPGWGDSLNGPSGVLAAIGKGLMHVFCRKLDARTDLLPVDIAIDTLLAVAWETAVDKLPEVKVYNCSTYENPTRWDDFEKAIEIYIPKHPFDECLWYPSGFGVENRYINKILVFFLQTIPLYLAEYIFKALGVKMKVNLITVEQKMRGMNEAFAFFTLREWEVKTDNVAKLRARLTPGDAAIYNLDPQSIDWNEQYENLVKGTRKYLLKEKDEDIEEAKRHCNRMYYVHKCMIYFVMILVFALVVRNEMVQDIVYEGLRLLLSLLHAGYNFVWASRGSADFENSPWISHDES